MKREVCIDKALPENKKRMIKYKTLAVSFSYPEDEFFSFFPQMTSERDELCSEYDRLFRGQEIWLYSSEYICENEFQRANNLADINGFYRAFGLKTTNDRPDSLVSELEFIHYLIFKTVHAQESAAGDNQEKVSICLDAQKKFFDVHLYPAAQKISSLIIAHSKNKFYRNRAKELLKFLESEASIFRK